MLYNGFTFRRAIGEKVFTVGEGFNDGSTAMWSGKEATESFVEDLLLDPMKLLGKKDPIAALPERSMYQLPSDGRKTERSDTPSPSKSARDLTGAVAPPQT